MSWISGTGNVWDELVSIEEGLGSTAAAEPTAVDGVGEFPFWMNYLRSGDYRTQGAGWGYGVHTIVCEFHIMRGSLPDNEVEIRPYVRDFYRAVANDPTLGDTVTSVNAIRYTIRAWEYSGAERHVGIEFELDVKVAEDTS